MKKIVKLDLKENKDSFIYEAFEVVERQMIKSGIDYNYSGTCACLVFIKDDICTIANLGDSRAVLCRTNKDINAIELSWDHKPTRKDEKSRILLNGGKVEKLNYNGDWFGPYRVWIDEEGPGYGMTRTLGDIYSKKIGLISKPEIEHIKLKKSDQFIILASDGLWEVMSSAEAVGFVLHNKEHWENENKVS